MRDSIEIKIDISLLGQAMALARGKSRDDVVNDCLKRVIHAELGFITLSDFEKLVPDNELVWSRKSERQIAKMDLQQYLRSEVSYNPAYLEEYVPNQTQLLPAAVKFKLRKLEAAPEPCSKEVMRVLYRNVRLDMIWGSVRLEGTSYTRRGAEKLLTGCEHPHTRESDALVGLKRAFDILFLSDHKLRLDVSTVREIQAALKEPVGRSGDSMAGDPAPMFTRAISSADEIEEPKKLLDLVIEKAAAIRNPFEASFFLWLHLSHLLCFEDGIERTARFAMNIPLLTKGYYPITFYEVNRNDYVMSLVAYFESGDPSIAVDLFSWACRQSVQRYPGFYFVAVNHEARFLR
ncbi:Fic family protein [Herbaspirillum huttiense]|uniref:Fic family protein n=1 Tax=Herbaspirillum huttiense TaxID=863372 RepID=UPI003B3A0E74